MHSNPGWAPESPPSVTSGESVFAICTVTHLRWGRVLMGQGFALLTCLRILFIIKTVCFSQPNMFEFTFIILSGNMAFWSFLLDVL